VAGQDGIEVVGSVVSGQKALEFVQTTPPDVVTLDVEMPAMNGLKTLRAIQRVNATRSPAAAIGVIMVSAHTKRGAEVTMQALRDGAFDFVAKPRGPNSDENREQLRQQLVTRLHQFLLSRKRAAGRQPAAEPPATPRGPLDSSGRRRQWHPGASRRPVRALLIAASTGGPKALETLLPGLCERTDVLI